MDNELRKILRNINEGRFYPEQFDFTIDKNTANILVKKAVDESYVSGVSFIKIMGASDSYKAQSDAKLTYEGLTFL